MMHHPQIAHSGTRSHLSLTSARGHFLATICGARRYDRIVYIRGAVKWMRKLFHAGKRSAWSDWD
jgi:hypothetical protein